MSTKISKMHPNEKMAETSRYQSNQRSAQHKMIILTLIWWTMITYLQNKSFPHPTLQKFEKDNNSRSFLQRYHKLIPKKTKKQALPDQKKRYYASNTQNYLNERINHLKSYKFTKKYYQLHHHSYSEISKNLPKPRQKQSSISHFNKEDETRQLCGRFWTLIQAMLAKNQTTHTIKCSNKNTFYPYTQSSLNDRISYPICQTLSKPDKYEDDPTPTDEVRKFWVSLRTLLNGNQISYFNLGQNNRHKLYRQRRKLCLPYRNMTVKVHSLKIREKEKQMSTSIINRNHIQIPQPDIASLRHHQKEAQFVRKENYAILQTQNKSCRKSPAKKDKEEDTGTMSTLNVLKYMIGNGKISSITNINLSIQIKRMNMYTKIQRGSQVRKKNDGR